MGPIGFVPGWVEALQPAFARIVALHSVVAARCRAHGSRVVGPVGSVRPALAGEAFDIPTCRRHDN